MNYGAVEVKGLVSSTPRKERWPTLFWSLLKILGLFHHNCLVTERKCFPCHVKYIRKRNAALVTRSHKSRTTFETIDSLMLSYERDEKDDHNFDKRGIRGGTHEEVDCQVCMTLWWNSNRQLRVYTDEEIGVSGWNHRGSSKISLFVLLLLLVLSVYSITYAIIKLWDQPGRTTELLTEIVYFLFTASNSFAVLCCKLKCIFKDQLPLLGWASMLNARYIIKRAQLLDLHSNGLPGRLFLVLCICWPLINSCIRCVLFLTFTEPQEEDAYTRAVLTSIVGLVMMETWGIFVYILYIVRISLQHHFTLLLSFIEEHEGHIDVCRGALSEVVSDFSCFRRFSHIYTLVMLPIAFVAMASNLSWEYLMYKACRNNADVAKVQTIITALAWSEIVMAICLYIAAAGAINIMYMWDNFFRDVKKLHSERHDKFWRKMIRYMSAVSNNETNFFLVTVIFSVLGVFMALNIQSQDASYFAKDCNVSNDTDYNLSVHAVAVNLL